MYSFHITNFHFNNLIVTFVLLYQLKNSESKLYSNLLCFDIQSEILWFEEPFCLPFSSYNTFLVWALYCLLTLTFDLLTSRLVHEVYITVAIVWSILWLILVAGTRWTENQMVRQTRQINAKCSFLDNNSHVSLIIHWSSSIINRPPQLTQLADIRTRLPCSCLCRKMIAILGCWRCNLLCLLHKISHCYHLHRPAKMPQTVHDTIWTFDDHLCLTSLFYLMGNALPSS